MDEHIVKKYISRIEEMEGRSASVIINEFYSIRFYSINYISKKWKISNRGISMLLKHFNIPIRYGSEAIKAQWINNDERKKNASENLRKYVSKAPHPNLGKNRFNCERMKVQSERQKIKSSFFNPEVRTKCILTERKNYALNPSKHINARTNPSRFEQLAINHFKELGYEVVFNYNISPYWIDIFIPSLNIDIECFHHSRLPFDYQRHYYITSKGITVFYISNNCILSNNFAFLDYNISNINKTRLNPSFNCQDTMIVGTKYATPFINYFDKLTIEHINVDKINTLLISTTPNN